MRAPSLVFVCLFIGLLVGWLVGWFGLFVCFVCLGGWFGRLVVCLCVCVCVCVCVCLFAFVCFCFCLFVCFVCLLACFFFDLFTKTQTRHRRQWVKAIRGPKTKSAAPSTCSVWNAGTPSNY